MSFCDDMREVFCACKVQDEVSIHGKKQTTFNGK